MDMNRRRLLQLGALGLAGTVLSGLAACGDDDAAGGATGGDSKELALWYWSGGLSKKVLDGVAAQFPDVKVTMSEIGGTFKEKLLTTMSGRSGIPDITGVKGEDISTFLAQQEQFLDLNDLGFDKVKSQYLEWKWRQATTKDGKVIGFPIDIGPTGLYYRTDVYEKAGLPTDPDKVSAAMPTWDAFFDAGVELKGKVPGAFMVVETTAVFDMAIGQGAKRFVDENNKFIGDQEHVRAAWDLAVRSLELGINAKTPGGSQDFNAALVKGTLPSVIGAAWLALDIRSAAESTSGKWRVAATPGGPGNYGGSFLTIPKASRNPTKSFEIISWILSPDNQAQGFTDAAIFPAAPATYAMPALNKPDPFFGDQVTIKIFGPAAEKIPVAYEGPNDAAVKAPFYTELSNVEAKGKKSDEAWNDAVEEAKKIGERLGVS
jgi:cellobiose transport system substrate-binding protein